ncbi:MAG: dockerin type I domain-containing protein, partial [Patescibacteria group bacterium]|nr:dockerin type I domain-containing protein [Patescibacteria group bacterium]
NTDADGIYLHNFDTAILEEGGDSAKAKSRLGDEASAYGSSVAFQVGGSNIIFDPDRNLVLVGDSNNDSRVNLIDFSIMAYWYRRPNPPLNVDLNNDGKVDLIDFSIMAYYWTG